MNKIIITFDDSQKYESKDIYKEFLINYKKVFFTLNLNINYNILVFTKNNTTGHCFILENINGNLKETMIADEDFKKYVPIDDNQMVIFSDPFFVEAENSFEVTGALIITEYQDLCKKIDKSLLEAVIAEENGILGHPIACRNHQFAVNYTGKELMESQRLTTGLIEGLNAITALKYESKEICSKLIIASDDVVNILNLNILFEDPVEKKDYKTIRKLLEVSTQDFVLVGTQSFFYGFINMNGLKCQLEDNCKFSSKQAYIVYLKGILIWDIYKYNCETSSFLPYISSNMTNISYPNQKLAKSTFLEEVSSKFESYNAEALWGIVTQAVEQKHGTMIVVTDGAEKESERLRKCAIKINKVSIAISDVTKNISAIDGAIMCDPQGYCYAIGVILDGIHSEGNDESISRGARYNSAHRYKYNNKYNCLIVIVSEDGEVNLV